MLVRVVAVLILISLFVIAARRAKLVPGRGQNIAELALDFVRVSIAEEILGKVDAKRFVPMLTTIFFAILAFNVAGIIPGLNIAGTSLIGLPLLMAVWVYLMYLGSGIKKFGVGGYLKNNLLPPGIPWPLYILIAGHLLLVLCFSATHFFLIEAAGAMKGVAVLSLGAGFIFTLFELLVAALQAYVFTLLGAVYISLAIEDTH